MKVLYPAPDKDRTLGISGGLGALAGADLFFKLLKSQPLLADQGRYHLLFEQRPFKGQRLTRRPGASMTSSCMCTRPADASPSRAFGKRYQWGCPSAQSQAAFMEAVYGASGIKAGHLARRCIALARGELP